MSDWHSAQRDAGHPERAFQVVLPTERVCEDCMDGAHDACRREGGYMDDEDNDQRCGCHLTEHLLDKRRR